MVKSLLILLIIILPGATYAQAIDTTIVKLPITDSLVQYKKVITINDSVNKEKLFDAVINWIKLRHTNPANVIKVSDKSSGRIVGVTGVSLYVGKFIAWRINVMYRFDIIIHDNEYRIYVKGIKRDFAMEKYQIPQNIVYESIEEPYFKLLNFKTKGRDARYDKAFFTDLNKYILEMMGSIETFVSKNTN